MSRHHRVNPKATMPFEEAVSRASERLEAAGIPHALCGGGALRFYGYDRSTRDIDFLVGDDAFTHHGGGIVLMRPEVPVTVGGWTIDLVSAPDENWANDLPLGGVVGLGILVEMKLAAWRHRDQADLHFLLSEGIVDPEDLDDWADTQDWPIAWRRRAARLISRIEED